MVIVCKKFDNSLTFEIFTQVHVVESQRESAVAIGVAGRNYALDQMPGWQEGSIAYHLDDGNLFVQAGDPARFGPVCLQGDVVGCRVKFAAGRNCQMSAL